MKKEDERRMNFSFAVAEMIAMAPHTKQLLLQVRVASLPVFLRRFSAKTATSLPSSFSCFGCALFDTWNLVWGSCELLAGHSCFSDG